MVRFVKATITETKLRLSSRLELKNKPLIDLVISFESESGSLCESLSWCLCSFDLAEEKNEYNQLCRLGHLIGTNNLDNFVGRKVCLIINEEDEEFMVYAIGTGSYGLFIIPEVYYICNNLKPSKDYYTFNEVITQINRIRTAKKV